MGRWLTRTLDSGVVVICPQGGLNMSVAPQMREELHRLVDEGNTRIVVDLSGVETMDSSGLGALISGLKAARQAGGDLRIAEAGDQVIEVLKLTNLDRILRPHDSAERAFDEPV